MIAVPILQEPRRGMRALDALPWRAGICFASFGVRIGVRLDRPELLDEVATRLPPLRRLLVSGQVGRLYSVHTGSDGRFVAFEAGRELARSSELEEVLDGLESDLHLHVAQEAPDRIFLHAGVVAWRGRAVLVPGRSMSGKSTLVAALVEAGATYFSDEYAVLDGEGRVHAYPRLLSLRQPGGQRPKRVAAESLGGRAGVRRVPVGLVVVTRFRPGVRFDPAALAPGLAMLALLKNAVAARRRAPEVMARVSRIVSGAAAIKGPRGEADEAAGAILERLDGK